MCKYSTDWRQRPRPKTLLGVKKQPLALKRNQPAESETVLPSQNPYSVWLQKKLKIFPQNA